MGRKARGMDGIEREWKPDERYWLYMRGFKDGASAAPLRPDHTDIDDYQAGYRAGFDARIRASKAFARKVGYKPNILRLMEKETRRKR